MSGMNVRKWVSVSFLSLSFFSLKAEGPEDLERLAAEARKAIGETEPVQVDPAAAKQAVENTLAKVVAKADPAARQAALGMLSLVRDDAEGVFSFYDGQGLWGEIEESKFGQTALRLLAMNDVDLKDPESLGMKAAALFADEVLVVVGKGTPKQARNLVRYSEWSNAMQIETMLKLLVTEDWDMMAGPSAMPFMQDPDFVANLLAASEMPPVLLGFRLSDDDLREEFGASLMRFPEMAGMFIAEMDFIEAVQFEKAGITFKGLQVDGEGFIDFLEESGKLDGLNNVLKPATVQDVCNALRTKDLLIAGGKSEKGIFVYLGSNQNDIPLVDADKGSKSLTDGEALSFLDAYLNKRLLTVSWLSQDLMTQSREGQSLFGSTAKGLRSGLKDVEGLGETNRLFKLLGQLIEQEEALMGAFSYQAAASLSYLAGDGLHGELFGGVLDEAIDLNTPHQLGELNDAAFYTLHYVENPKMAKQTNVYLETLGETVDEMANVATRLKLDSPKFENFTEGYGLYREKFRKDLMTLWTGLAATSEGLGHEGIFEIDLRGTMPPIAGCPDVVVEKGVAPRLTLLSPVKDRAKLAESWKEIDDSAQNLLKTSAEMSDTKIPQLKPMSSESDGLKTWFFPVPMQTDDFVPSVTLDDSVLAMSTSKDRAVALAKAAKKVADEPKAGMTFQMNFAPLQDFLSSWVTLLENHGDELLTEPEALEDFENNKEIIKDFVGGLSELNSLSGHSRLENGQVRGTWHLKTN